MARTDAYVAARLSKFGEMHNTDSVVIIVESFFYFALKGFFKRTEHGIACHRVKEFVFDFFDELNVFVDVVACMRVLRWSD